jgi:hypothetical protein
VLAVGVARCSYRASPNASAGLVSIVADAVLTPDD